MEPDGIHLRELVEVIVKMLSTICQQLWSTGETLGNWKLANVTPIYKKVWKEEGFGLLA